MSIRRVVTIVLVASLLTAGVAVAQSGYIVPWATVNNGGGSSSGNVYTVEGTMGQASGDTLSGGGYTVVGGYWVQRVQDSIDTEVKIFLPTIHR